MIGDGSYGDQYDAIPASESRGGSAGRKRRPKYDEIEQLIFAMRLQGMSDNEIHKELNRRIPWRTLDKVFARIKRFDRQAVWRAFRRQHLASASFEGEDPVREEFKDLLERMSIGPRSEPAEIQGAMALMFIGGKPPPSPGEIMNALNARGIGDDKAVEAWQRIRSVDGRWRVPHPRAVAEIIPQLELWHLRDDCKTPAEPIGEDDVLGVLLDDQYDYIIGERVAREALELLEEKGILVPTKVPPEWGDTAYSLVGVPVSEFPPEDFPDYYPVVGGSWRPSETW